MLYRSVLLGFRLAECLSRYVDELVFFLGLINFSIFITDIDDGIGCTLSKFADDNKLWGAVQMDLYRLEQLALVNILKFKKSKCMVLHLNQGSIHH